MKKKYAKPLPKVGEDIYIEGAMYLSHGIDDYNGGLAKVSKVKKGISGGEDTHYVSVEELPGHSWNWEYLAEEQDDLKKEYKKQRAHPDPDNSAESNCWD